MRTAKRWSGGTLAGAGVWVLVSGCASSPPVDPAAPLPTDMTDTPAAKPAEPVKEPVASGMECAPAEALCDGGLCKVTVKNACKQPVTCDLAIVAMCKNGQEMVEAKARARDTVAAEAEGEVGVVANCTMGQVVRTEVKEFRCQ